MPKETPAPTGIEGCPSLAEHFGLNEQRAEKVVTVTRKKALAANELPPDATVEASTLPSEYTETVKTTSAQGAFELKSRADQAPAAPSEAAPRPGAKPLQPGGRTADYALFWSSSELVWDTALAQALWQAQWQAQVQNKTDRDVPHDAAVALQKAYADTARIASEVTQRLNAFVDRIPSVGWKWDPSRDCLQNWEARLWKALYGLFLGWPMTALMVSFGAAFWFDLLSRMMNRRGTGPQPGSTPAPN